MIDARRLPPILRTVARDPRLGLRSGRTNGYYPELHLVEYQEGVLAWPEDEALALIAHEGAHVRQSFYFEQLPPEVLRDKEEAAVANVLEDERVDRWVRFHWRGLRDGMDRLDARAFGEARAGVGDELAAQLELPAEMKLPARWRFVWRLRMTVAGRELDPDPQRAVDEAVRRCLRPTQLAMERFPVEDRAPEAERRAHSKAFVDLLLQRVLPEFRSLKRADERRARQLRGDSGEQRPGEQPEQGTAGQGGGPSNAGDEPGGRGGSGAGRSGQGGGSGAGRGRDGDPRRRRDGRPGDGGSSGEPPGVPDHVLSEVARRAAEAGQEPEAWRRWARIQQGQKRLAAGGRLPRGQRVRPASPEYAELAESVEPEVARFVRRLRGALRLNEDPILESGYPSGPRLDLRQVFYFERDRSRYDALHQRPFIPDERKYRLALLADVSGSMEGEPLRILARSVVLCLEAAERLAVPSALVLFGCKGSPEQGRVRLVKDPDEPLAAARNRVAAQLLGDSALGSVSPLAAGLDRVRSALPPQPEGEDLVVVISDGRPTDSSWRYLTEELTLYTVDDKGRTGDASQDIGRVLMREKQAQVDEDVLDALIRLEERPGTRVLGVGVGSEARVDDYVAGARHFADFPAFAERFPDLVQDELLRAIRQRT